MHNPTVDETTNGRGRINRMLLKEIKSSTPLSLDSKRRQNFPVRGKNISRAHARS